MNIFKRIGKDMSEFLDAIEGKIAVIHADAGVTDQQVHDDVMAAIVPVTTLVDSQAAQIADLEKALTDLADKLGPGSAGQPVDVPAVIADAHAAVDASTTATANNVAIID